MIHVQNLVKLFGSVPALNGVSFDVAAGDVVGLLGPNGAGKSTTMRILSGAMPPTAGVVQVAGRDIRQAPLEVRRSVGYLPETPPVYPEMRVAAYLRFVAELKGVPSAQRPGRIEKALAQCRLEDRADQPIEQLSKGYLQRVGLAQAILHDPDLLLLDEPTSGLDPRQVVEVRQLIRELAGEHTVILSSHILGEIAASCERVIVMSRGNVIAADAVDALTQRFSSHQQIVLHVRGDGDELRDTIGRIDGVERLVLSNDPGKVDTWRCELTGPIDRDVCPQLARLVVEGGWDLLGMTRTELSLEEIFLRLTEVDADPDRKQDEEEAEARAA
jgi:ABC-2 type transport system ATP-binding protein